MVQVEVTWALHRVVRIQRTTNCIGLLCARAFTPGAVEAYFPRESISHF